MKEPQKHDTCIYNYYVYALLGIIDNFVTLKDKTLSIKL